MHRRGPGRAGRVGGANTDTPFCRAPPALRSTTPTARPSRPSTATTSRLPPNPGAVGMGGGEAHLVTTGPHREAHLHVGRTECSGGLETKPREGSGMGGLRASIDECVEEALARRWFDVLDEDRVEHDRRHTRP